MISVNNKYIKFFCFGICTLFFLLSCTNSHQKKINNSITPTPFYIKPVASFQDSLFITSNAAVFYHPDSLQLLSIKVKSESGVFESTMHEYEYQMKNAHNVLRKEWQHIKIIEAKNVRYLLFKKKNQDQIIIDLNTKGDPYGLVLFNGEKDPQLADMMNIDTQLYFYFSK